MISKNKLKALIANGLTVNHNYAPQFFRFSNQSDSLNFTALLNISGLQFHDQLYQQLKELFKTRNPSRRLTESESASLIEAHLNGCPIYEYGVWVYYPWSGNVVHLLDEAEFIEVRTAANKNKITIAERDILSRKTVGVIGLSVGQSVSITLALERSCGSLRLADFDTLELNNLNRIRTGVHNLGLLKAYAVAREIAEIDPFFKVVCYTEGITEENIDDFFTKDGKLDVVIDECDSVHIKILCRQKAKELQVPVLMEASDRGTLDVERFDLEPDRPILHGWLQHLPIDFNVLKNLKTTEEKIPYILPISGLDTLSTRMKASMIEIENTLTTWPQLATAVALGGAITADTCRRMFLGQHTGSGRFFIDLEKLIPDDRPQELYQPAFLPDPLSVAEMEELAARSLKTITPGKHRISHELVSTLVAAATSAPTAGNNQPWKWLLKDNCLFLFHDKYRSFSFGDYEDIASFAGLGAAIENLELAASHHKMSTRVSIFPLPDSKKLIASIQFNIPAESNNLYRPEELYKNIDLRCTNRNLGSRTLIATETYDRLKMAVASIPGASLIIKYEVEELNALAEIIGASDRLRLLHPDGHFEFYSKELRWDAHQSITSADGIDIATFEITPVDMVGLKLVSDPAVVKLLTDWNAGEGLKRTSRKAVNAASAIGLITMPAFSPSDFVMGGRALERMWLEATELGVSLQPMLAPVLHFARLTHGGGIGMPDFMIEGFKQLYGPFESIFPEIKDQTSVFLFRLCIAKQPIIKSYRIAVNKMLTFG
jgi:molybdopterin/thiamine biosynthesis adenylyltransferase